jgi:hypothetical protein
MSRELLTTDQYGTSRTYYNYDSGWAFTRDVDGRTSQWRFSGGRNGGVDRLLTGNEAGGASCPPNAPCKGPGSARDAIKKGTHTDPGSNEALGTVGNAPRIKMSEESLTGNPDIYTIQGGGGKVRSSRYLSGGKHINPGDPDL